MRVSYIVLAGVLLGISSGVYASKIYKWVDEHGQVHYGDAPAGKQSGVRQSATETEAPAGGAASDTQVIIEDQKRLTDSMQEDRRQRETEKAKKQQQLAEREQRCKHARSTLQQYETSGYLYEQDAGGNRKILNDQERRQAEDKVRTDIEKYCQ